MILQTARHPIWMQRPCRPVSTRGARLTSTPTSLPAIVVSYQIGVMRVILESLQRSYDEYRGVSSDLNEASGEECVDGESLEEFLERELLCV